MPVDWYARMAKRMRYERMTWGGLRNYQAKSVKVANNTYLERADPYGEGPIYLRLHQTRIVTYELGGKVTLHAHGWMTRTTKQRMHDFSPFSIWSDKRQWTVSSRHGVSLPYFEGISTASFHPYATGGRGRSHYETYKYGGRYKPKAATIVTLATKDSAYGPRRTLVVDVHDFSPEAILLREQLPFLKTTPSYIALASGLVESIRVWV